MTVLSDRSIRNLCRGAGAHLIVPLTKRTLHEPSGTSGGLGPCTYDVHLDKLDAQPVRLPDRAAPLQWVLHPGEFVLASTVERFCLPPTVCGEAKDKSSLARLGLAVQNTHLDPGWEGYLTLEISNHGNSAVRLWQGQPVAQIKFEWLDFPAEFPYRGKYQNQPAEPVAAILQRQQGD